MTYARPLVTRASWSSFPSCFAPAPLLRNVDSRILTVSLLTKRPSPAAQYLRTFSSSPSFSARNRFLAKPSQPVQKSGRAGSREGLRKGEDPRGPRWQNYDPEVGIPLPTGELAQATITDIFGPGMSDELGNHILRLMHYRRLSGSLIDVGVEFPKEYGISPEMAAKALDFLRKQNPSFDENEAGAAWAELEIMKVEQEYMDRAERLGIYKRSDSDPAHQPQSSGKSSDIYGESALDNLRRVNKARWMEEDRKKEEAKKQEEATRIAALKAIAKEDNVSTEEGSKDEIKAQPGKIYSPFDEIALAQPTQKAWLQPVERKAWVKYYEEQATIIKDNKIPKLSNIRRLGPSALVLCLVLGGCWFLDTMYTPPPRSARMFPDVPPAVATLGTITAINFAIFVAWRIPPLWRFMNKNFQVTAAYPFASGTFGAQFSHQSLRHLFANTIMLWPFGWILHDDVGRGTFLATYLACGTIGTYGSLVFNVLAKRWMSYSFGSSVAVMGIMAAACLVRANNNVTVLGYEIPDITGLTVLGMLAGIEILRAWRGKSTGTDYAGHLSGLTAGVLAGLYIRYREGGYGDAVNQMIRKEAVSSQTREDSE